MAAILQARAQQIELGEYKSFYSAALFSDKPEYVSKKGIPIVSDSLWACGHLQVLSDDGATFTSNFWFLKGEKAKGLAYVELSIRARQSIAEVRLKAGSIEEVLLTASRDTLLPPDLPRLMLIGYHPSEWERMPSLSSLVYRFPGEIYRIFFEELKSSANPNSVESTNQHSSLSHPDAAISDAAVIAEILGIATGAVKPLVKRSCFFASDGLITFGGLEELIQSWHRGRLSNEVNEKRKQEALARLYGFDSSSAASEVNQVQRLA